MQGQLWLALQGLRFYIQTLDKVASGEGCLGYTRTYKWGLRDRRWSNSKEIVGVVPESENTRAGSLSLVSRACRTTPTRTL